MLDDLVSSISSPDAQDIATGERTKFHRVLYLLLLVLFAWRLWAFTISPRLYRDRLEYLPYWIPCRFPISLFLRVTMANATRSRCVIRAISNGTQPQH